METASVMVDSDLIFNINGNNGVSLQFYIDVIIEHLKGDDIKEEIHLKDIMMYYLEDKHTLRFVYNLKNKE